MPTYEFKNALGEVREVSASMKTPLPRSIEFLEDGSWREASEPDAEGTFHRVWSLPRVIVNDAGGVRAGGALPVSESLPCTDPDEKFEIKSVGGHKVKRYKDGRLATLKNRPIVRNRDDRKKHCEKSGCFPKD